MTQFDFGTIDPETTSGTELADLLGDWRDSVHTCHRGAARPSYADASHGGLKWIKEVSATRWELYLWDGVGDILQGVFDTTNDTFYVVDKAGASIGAAEVDVASVAGTTDIFAAAVLSDNVRITGTNGTTALAATGGSAPVAGLRRWVRFSAALLLTHNATSLILPGSANITTAAGDRALFKTLTAGNVECVAYIPASGRSVITPNNIAAEISLAGFISPTQLSANTDNWNPTGLATASTIRASTDASRNLTGIVAPSTPRLIVLQNVGAFDLVLKDEVTSTAANRFSCPNAQDYTLESRCSVLILYDTGSARWRVLSVPVPVDTNGLVPITRNTGSGVAAYDWTSGIGSTYRTYKLKGWLRPATDQVDLWLRFSDDGGSTFEADASDYGYAAGGNGTGAFHGFSGATAAAQIKLTTSSGTDLVGNAATELIQVEITIVTPDSATAHKTVFWMASWMDTAGESNLAYGSGVMLATAAVNGFRVMFSSGNIAAGDMTLYGVVNA